MRIGYWSSDVCSSDLVGQADSPRDHAHRELGATGLARRTAALVAQAVAVQRERQACRLRPEERRVGKECISQCRSRTSTSHSKTSKTIKTQKIRLIYKQSQENMILT